jgi:hypothetical protein
VYAHARAQRLIQRPGLARKILLRAKRRGDRVDGRVERGAHAVARVFEQHAAVGLDRARHDLVVAAHGLLHNVGRGFPQTGRALQVGEQEGDGPAGKLAHG